MKNLLRLSALAFLMPVAACGDDGGGSGINIPPPQPFQSEQPDSTPANELTPAQQTAFCAESLAYFNASIPPAEFKKLTCAMTGFALGALTGASCNEIRSQCLASDEEVAFDLGDCDTSKLANCTATIAEVEACYTDSVEALADIAPHIGCNMSEETLQGYGEDPASCVPVRTKCPDLFESEDDAPIEE